MPAPGTTHACKRFIPEKVYLTAGFETDVATLFNPLQVDFPICSANSALASRKLFPRKSH